MKSFKGFKRFSEVGFIPIETKQAMELEDIIFWLESLDYVSVDLLLSRLSSVIENDELFSLLLEKAGEGRALSGIDASDIILNWIRDIIEDYEDEFEGEALNILKRLVRAI